LSGGTTRRGRGGGRGRKARGVETPPPAPARGPRHLLGIAELDRKEIEAILESAAAFKEVMGRPIKKVPTLRGKVVINLFFEPSTRTRTSFEIAGKMLSADVINFTASASSLGKGETLLDTARSLRAMRPDVLVVRSASAGVPWLLARHLDCAILNAGDGAHEHPSQALLDAFTLKERWGSLDGRTIAIVGDIRRSRVAGSNVRCLTKLGAKVRVCGPGTMLPRGIERLGRVTVHHRMDEAITGADAVMMLRIQKERSAEPLLPSDREYSRLFGLSPRNVDLTRPGALILHPGPLNRGVEIDPAIADGSRSLILDQVENGVAVRMALLYLSVRPAGASLEAPAAEA
jgi:aspartate carbamoyltransferase catalytic subunit